MQDINNVILIGRLTRDPELRKTQNGTSVCSFTLAVNRRQDTNGNSEADFVNCVAWDKLADVITLYKKKGARIALEGRIQTRTYDNQIGQKVYVTEVVAENVEFLDSKPQQANNAPVNNWNENEAYCQPVQNTYSGAQQMPNQTPQSNSYNASYSQPSLTQQAEKQAYDDALDIDTDDLPF